MQKESQAMSEIGEHTNIIFQDNVAEYPEPPRLRR